jgi:hypothetical protein
MSIVNQYIYLGIIFDEFLDFNVTAKFLADAGNRALGVIIGGEKMDLGIIHTKNCTLAVYAQS